MKQKRILNMILETMGNLLMFIFIQYLLACFYFSFHSHPFSVIFTAVNITTILQFRINLKNVFKSALIPYIFLILGIIIVGAVLVLYGYFPISTTPLAVSL